MEDENVFRTHLQAIGKLNYIKGDRPKVDCILCCIRDNDPRVESLKVYEDDQVFITLNRYPYNPGHLMVIPRIHIEKFEDLSDQQRDYLFNIVIKIQKLLQEVFQPIGFNVGYNQGQFAGASINHIHVHVVPRYKSELGFIDIIGQARIVPEDVYSVYQKIKAKIPHFFPNQLK